VVASTLSDNSLHLKVEIVTTDTQKVKSVDALVDCKATGLFLDRDYVEWNKTLSHAIPVYNVDSTLNEEGFIHKVVDIILCYWDHFQWADFVVTGPGKQDIILGYSWLHKHHMEVNWSTRRSRCHAVQVAAVPAGLRYNRSITSTRQKPVTYVPVVLALCPL
jgi:hypothetical protein